MSRPEDRRRIRMDQGPTTAEVSPEGIRIASRGATLGFGTVTDFMDFVNEISILAVRISEAFTEAETPNPDNSGEPRENQ